METETMQEQVFYYHWLGAAAEAEHYTDFCIEWTRCFKALMKLT